MTVNIVQDWPVYVLLGVVVFFYAYVIIKGNQTEKEKNDVQASDKGKK